ncbi:MAG TPA: glycoside hydrolase family 43 protein [Pyrinomonadaceae bacterium]|nr:glycoside hydrolase family 43 protein [Pyrinomonadaceae bacterium]
MKEDSLHPPARQATYLNPVYDRDFPDPYVLKFAGEYWAYCTGLRTDGRAFGILHSRDLVNWREVGTALEPLPGNHPCYWAPEVVHEQGRFLMYYSVGDEVHMTIRVAVADSPTGPFVDSGRNLTREQFAIDAHVFIDDDGTRYLFYATDFLEHTHIGTGTVRDLMLDPFTLAGRPVPVTRARYDWQVYDPVRKEKGGVRWHTVEGPTVLKHKGRYYEMFSGGNWQNTTYGVSFASSERVDDPREWAQLCDGESVLPILRTVPGRVIGPGHNSVVRGPDNRQLFCVYHRWAEAGRVMAIDRLDWVGDGMIVLGPSTTPQPAPLTPTFTDFFDGRREALGEGWQRAGGRWTVAGGEAVQEDATAESSEARCLTAAASFLAEMTLRRVSEEDAGAAGGSYGVTLRAEDGLGTLEILLEPETRCVRVASNEGDHDSPHVFAKLPDDFDFSARHLLRLEADEGAVSVRLDEAAFRWQGRTGVWPARLALATRGASAAFGGFALTLGWEELFMDASIEARGWQAAMSGETVGKWYVRERRLWYAPASEERGVIWKGTLLENYELVVNACLSETADDSSDYGFYPAYAAEEGRGPLVALVRTDAGWALELMRESANEDDANKASGAQQFPLPRSFNPQAFQQFRFIKLGGRLTIQYGGESVATVDAPPIPTRVALTARGSVTAFDLVRVTMIQGA